MIKSNFIGNRADKGGGIYASDNSILNITGTRFDQNRVITMAGALVILSNSKVTIEDSFFTNLNSIGPAAAILLKESRGNVISSSHFTNNTSS